MIPQIRDSRNVMGMMIKNPRSREIVCAFTALSIEVKYVESTILNPAKGIAVKYSFIPDAAVCCSRMFCSLLNRFTIESVQAKNTQKINSGTCAKPKTGTIL